MNPPNVKETLELVNQYGVALVLVVILMLFFLAVFVFMLRWAIHMNRTQTENGHKEKMALADLVNSGLKSVSDGLNQNTLVCQEIMRNQKDGFDVMRTADNFHRQDLKDITTALKSSGCKFEPHK